ncbi:hypothetical protein JL720_13570 [Aureococcus anophagefferens]|nr:hypothetical protein JL720_13570 [Aureococcus anophagefferens]
MKRETKEKQELDNYEKGSAMRKMIGPQLLQMENLDPAVDGAWAEMNRQGLMDQFIRNPRTRTRSRSRRRPRRQGQEGRSLIAGGGHERKKSMITRQGVAKHGFMSTAEMLRTFIDTRVALALKKQATQLIGIAEKMDLLEGYMTMAEFQVLIEDSTLLRSQGDDDELTLKEVRQAFAGAQTDIDLDSGDLAPKKAPKRKAPKGNLSSRSSCPAEFLEAVLRLAMLKWEADEHDADAVTENAGLQRGASNFNRG